MTVKDRVGRVRYIAFRVEADPPPTRRQTVEALRAAWGPAFEAEGAWLTAFDGRRGLLRVKHLHAKEARSRLSGIREIGGRPVRVEPIATSGTARGAKARLSRSRLL